jgi:hypothetical protein
MTDLPKECTECKKSYEFDEYASGSCNTCKKISLCYDCCFNHECIPGKFRQWAIVNNPQWIRNLMKTLESKEKFSFSRGEGTKSKYKNEIYDEIIEELKNDG